METASQELLDAIADFDSATIFNAVVKAMGGSQGGKELEGKGGIPVNYTGPELSSHMPDMGVVVGYAVTAEVTCMDPDSEPLDWDAYYDMLDAVDGPTIAVLNDVDSQPGRGAAFGDGMAAVHNALGAKGAVVGGSIRDVAGIREIGLPMWSTGVVPGHGVFNMVRLGSSVTVAGLRIAPGDLLVADGDGCTKISADQDLNAVLQAARDTRSMESTLKDVIAEPGFSLQKYRDWRADYLRRQSSKSYV